MPEETTYPFSDLFATLHELGRDRWSGPVHDFNAKNAAPLPAVSLGVGQAGF
jgi:hypothetical protein